MPINTLATATLFRNTLDKVTIREAVAGQMGTNAGRAIYNGGAEVKILRMSVQGLGDYDRDSGYQQDEVALEYEARKMTQDKGRKFQINPIGINENNFIAITAAVMGGFQRALVVPEIDAYRISKIVTETIAAKKAGMVSYGYTPGVIGTSALRKIKEGIKAIRELYNGPLVVHATSSVIIELGVELSEKITSTTFSKGGIETAVPSVDGVPIISTPSNRMYTAITIYDGKTSGQEKSGYMKGTTTEDINFSVCPRTTPIAATKQDIIRIFDLIVNQKLNVWQIDYRRFHDIWVLDNEPDSVYLGVKDAAPSEG